MHSFQPSRGRVLFEGLCALGIAASLFGAWLQTHATALLGAAGVAALYAVVHLFDMGRGKEREATEPQRAAFEPEAADIIVPVVAAEERPAVESIAEEAGAIEPSPTRTGSDRRSGGSRKGGGRRSKVPKAAKAVEPDPVNETDVPWPMAEEAKSPEAVSPPEEEFVFMPGEEAEHPHIAPLFEPEPYVRMPRRAFGRKSG